MDIKNISNNDVADATSDKKQLDLRKRDRQIMSEQTSNAEDLQIVSLSTNWAAPPETRMTVKDTLWDFTACGLPYLWTHYGIRGDGVNVFVLDTGIDINHTAFVSCKNRITAKSFVNNVPSPSDGCGHGTWVSGKIIGAGIGIAPACNLYSLKVLDDSGTGKIEFTNKALEWILKQNDIFPYVVNMSLGSTKKNVKQEKLIWQLYKKGCVVVVASGNNNSDENFYPADYSGVLSVSAVDKQQTRAGFSNYGADIAVCAPGVSCYSTYMGGGFRLLQGTSMASPTVAGLIALGISYMLRKGVTPGIELRDRIISALENSAKDLGEAGRDPYYGFGCIDGKGFFEKISGGLTC